MFREYVYILYICMIGYLLPVKEVGVVARQPGVVRLVQVVPRAVVPAAHRCKFNTENKNCLPRLGR